MKTFLSSWAWITLASGTMLYCGCETAAPEVPLHETESAAGTSQNGLSSINGLSSLNGLTSINGLSSLNGLSSINGLSSLNGLMTTSAGRSTVSYIVKCALPSNRSITKVVSGTTYTFPGQLGLAPEWETSACTSSCQEHVSACVLAHVNTSGQHVALWLDGDNSNLGWGRSTDYPYQEGSFFGNIFIDNPKAYFCNGKDFDVGLVAGRLGVGSGAPYSNPFGAAAYCKDHCVAADFPYNNDGYKACNGYNHVITVWRNFDPNIDYKVCNRSSGKCLDVAGGSMDDTAAVVQYGYSGASNQRWRIKQVSPGKYTFMNVKSGKVMDIAGASNSDGTGLIQFGYKGGANQMWSFTPTGTGYYKFSPASNLASSLDVPSWSTSDGTKIQEWTWKNGTNQQWNIVPAN